MTTSPTTAMKTGSNRNDSNNAAADTVTSSKGHDDHTGCCYKNVTIDANISTILNGIHFAQFKFTGAELLQKVVQIFAILLLTYIILPQHMFYLILLILFILMLVAYIVSSLTFDKSKAEQPINPEKLASLRSSWRQSM